MTSTLSIQTLDWLSMRLSVPEDWDLARHSTRPQRGRLAMVDRRRQRLNLTWTECPGQPDLQRMINDQQSRDLAACAEDRIEAFGVGHGWEAYRRIDAEERSLVRAVRYEAQLQRLIELVIPLEPYDPPELAEMVLERFEVTQPAAGRGERLRALGVDVDPPTGWTLTELAAQPGAVMVRYTRGRHELSVKRLSAPEAWYGDDPQKLLRRELGRREAQFIDGQVYTHRSCSAHSREEGPLALAWLGRLRQRVDAVWRCPRDSAVFHLTALFPTAAPIEPTDLKVRCCELAG